MGIRSSSTRKSIKSIFKRKIEIGDFITITKYCSLNHSSFARYVMTCLCMFEHELNGIFPYTCTLFTDLKLTKLFFLLSPIFFFFAHSAKAIGKQGVFSDRVSKRENH